MTTRAFENVTAAISIEGIGLLDNVSGSTRFAYVCDRALFTDTGFTPARVADGALASIPGSISTKINPLLGSYELSAQSFDLVLDDAINTKLRQKAYLQIGSLASAVTSSQTTIPLNISGLDGTVIYVEDETILLGVFGGGQYTGCTRGYHDSNAAPHSANVNVYDQVPYWAGRLVKFETWSDATCAWETRWIGRLRDSRVSNDGTTLTLQCAELLSGLKHAKVNRDAPDIRRFGDVGLSDSNLADILPFTGTATYQPRTRKISETTAPIVVKQGDVMALIPRAGSTLYFSQATVFASGEPGRDGTVEIKGKMVELLCVSKRADEVFGNVSFTSALPYPYHPVSIAAALLCSTDNALTDAAAYDVTTPAWSYNISQWLDIGSFTALIEETREVEIDQLYLGADGAENLINIINDVLLRPYGFVLAPTQSGILAVSRLRTLDAQSYCDALNRGLKPLSPARGGGIEWRDGLDAAVDVINAEVGKTPVANGIDVTINIQGNSRRQEFFGDTRVHTYDFRTIERTTVGNYGDSDSGDDTVNRLIANAIIANWQAPTIQITVPDSRLFSMSYDLGVYYAITDGPEDPWYTTNAGTRIKLPSVDEGETIQFVGMMVGRRYNVSTQNYTVDLLLLAYRTGRFTRLRAPSMEIVAADTGNQTVSSAVDSEFGALTSDAACFKQGDQVELVSRFGVTLSGPQDVNAVSDPEVQLASNFGTDPMGETHPTFLEMADSSVYSNLAHISCTSRPWTYLANASDELTTPTGTAPADIYG